MENYTFDLHRIFIGDLPTLFFVEIAMRTVILYLYTVFMVRLLGQRSVGELTSLEVVMVVTLGSAAGDPMFYPDVPLLHGMAVITTIVALQYGLLFITHHNRKIENVIDGRPVRLIYNSLLDLDHMRKARISKEEVFQELRQENYKHLGEIERTYLEADGKFSVYPYEDQPQPGLSFYPAWDEREPEAFQPGEDQHMACMNCGNTIEHQEGFEESPCPNCGKIQWVRAVES